MRAITLVCCVCLAMLCGAVSGAVLPSPAFVALVTEAAEAIDTISDPVARADGTLELIDLQLAVAPKTPHDDATLVARRATLRKLIDEINDPITKAGLIEAVISLAIQLEDYDTAFELIEKLSEATRLRTTLVLIGQIISSEGWKKTNLVARLEAILPRVAEQADLKSLGAALLGKVYALQGNKEAAAVAFAQAVETASQLEALEEQNLLGLVVSLEVSSGMLDAAKKVATSQKHASVGQYLWGMLTLALLETPAAERDAALPECLAGLTDDEIRMVAVISLVQRLVTDNADNAALESWVAREKSNEGKATVASIAAEALLEAGRYADAAVFATLAGDRELADTIVLTEIDAFVRNKKWDEATQAVERVGDLTRRGSVLAGLLVAANRHKNDAVAVKVAARLDSPAARDRIKQLRESVGILAKATDPQSVSSRIDELGVLFGQQFVLGDLDGARTTLDVILAALPTNTDAEKRFEVLVQSLAMKTKLLPQTEVVAFGNAAGKQIVAAEGVENRQRLAGLLFCAAAAGDSLPAAEATEPLAAVATFARTIQDPIERSAALLTVARQWAQRTAASDEPKSVDEPK